MQLDDVNGGESAKIHLDESGEIVRGLADDSIQLIMTAPSIPADHLAGKEFVKREFEPYTSEWSRVLCPSAFALVFGNTHVSVYLGLSMGVAGLNPKGVHPTPFDISQSDVPLAERMCMPAKNEDWFTAPETELNLMDGFDSGDELDMLSYLMRRLSPADTQVTVFDPFVTSGLIGAAAISEGHNYIGLAKDKATVQRATEIMNAK